MLFCKKNACAKKQMDSLLYKRLACIFEAIKKDKNE